MRKEASDRGAVMIFQYCSQPRLAVLIAMATSGSRMISAK